ncbi:MAG: hypothetical protein ABWY45_12245 [Mycobacterium sp.]
MAADFDVAGRLAEGGAALDNTQTYVSASAARGYRHPDLTLHSRQVQDWYGTEDGLDLRTLDADCVALRAAAQSLAEVSRGVRAQLAAVTSAWDGEGAGAAIDFLTRHADRADQVTIAVEAAARSCERLRDELWRIVDGRVDSTVSLDARTVAQRPAWLTAARTVIAGGSGSEDAGSVVDSEITPFVATAVSSEWVSAMRAAESAVIAAYRTAVDAVASRPAVRFDIPGDLAPAGRPWVAPAAATVPVSAPAIPAPTIPAATMSGSLTPPTAFEPVAGSPAAVPAAAPVAAPPPAALAAPPSMPTAPPAVPGEPASALGGLPGRFADALGGLFGGGSPGTGGLPGLSEFGSVEPGPLEPVDMPDPDSDLEPDPDADAVPEDDSIDEADEADEADGVDEEAEVEGEEPDETGGEPPSEPPAEVLEPDCPDSTEPAPTAPDPVPPAPLSAPAPDPAVDPAATPCEIAADELPQVGQ